MKRIFLVSVLVGVSLALLCWRYMHRVSGVYPHNPQLLAISPKDVIGSHAEFKGKEHAMYSLVEFADYQCLPCMVSNVQISTLLKEYEGKIRFTFRNYPLPFHKQAMPAALAAEAARQQGKFWIMHDALYEHQQTLSKTQIAALVDALKLDRKQFLRDYNSAAKKVVAEDIKIADSINIQGTPTYILCCPGGKVVCLTSLNQVKRYVR